MRKYVKRKVKEMFRTLQLSCTFVTKDSTGKEGLDVGYFVCVVEFDKWELAILKGFHFGIYNNHTKGGVGNENIILSIHCVSVE